MPCLRQVRLIAPFQNLRLIDDLAPILAARVEANTNTSQCLEIWCKSCRYIGAIVEMPNTKTFAARPIYPTAPTAFPQASRDAAQIGCHRPNNAQPPANPHHRPTQQLPSLPRINPIRAVHQHWSKYRHLSGKLIIRRCRDTQITFQLQAHVFAYSQAV